jgi:hypothetical protein
MGPFEKGLIESIFFLTWIVLGVSSWRRDRREDAATKRRKALPRAASAGGLFVAFVFVLSDFDWKALWIAFPVSLIAWLGLKNTRYCHRCNATLYNGNRFIPIRFCSKCGAKLARTSVEADLLE